MLLDWWNGIVNWYNSYEGHRVFTDAILPFLAILVAGILAGLIARGSIKRLLAQQEGRYKASAVETLIAAGRKAAAWNTLTAQEKEHVEHQTSEAEIRVRMLPAYGASLAADWSAHKLASMKRNSANYSFQADQDLVDYQDGLIAWHAKPSLAKKLFAQDLAAWKYDGGAVEDQLVVKQREWAAQQPDSAPAFESAAAGDR
ncbi:MAG: hypothetical protein JWP19_159 [Rhodoglobus sp.]|jgi:hypothetical protein|nr:hypothetical protein [Rhodoglobus sp.]